MMADQVYLEADGLRSAMGMWRANVPGATAYPELPAAGGVDDAATAAVLAAMTHWPVEHAAMATHRESMATRLDTASVATTGILSAADDDGDAAITAVEV